MKHIFTLCSIAFLFAISNYTTAQWQHTNGPRGGYVSCYANNEDEIYVGTQYGGVFRSTNNGASWSARNHGLKSYEINCIAMDGDELYVGSRMGGYDGLCHSSDDGMTWSTFPNLWTSYEPSCVAASGDNIYVGTAGGGNFFSHDGGASWSSSISGIVPYVYYVTSQVLILEDKLLTIVNGKIYESLDGGLTYNQLDDGFAEGVYPSKISVVGANLFAASFSGLYTSTDGGAFWSPISADLPEMPYGMSMSTAGNYIYIAGGVDGAILFSNNNGFDWSTLNTNWDTGMSSFHALSNGELLIQSGSYSVDWSIFDAPQLHYSGDNGGTWADVTNEITSTWCLSLNADGDDIYVGTQFTGMYKTSNEGDSWELSSTPDYWVSMGAMATFGNTIMVAGDGGMLRSIDDGATWTVCNEGLQATGTLAFAQVGTDIFATSPAGVFVSTDDGQTWTDSNYGIADDYVKDITNIDNILFAVSETGVYTSTNFGNSWSDINGDLPSDFHPYKIGHMGDVLFVSGNDSGIMFKSNNGGVSWTSMNFETLGIPATFAVQDEMLFVGVNANLDSPGVFMTNDLGETWTDVSNGLDNNLVFDMIVNNGWVYACTKGSGVYKRPLAEFLPENIAEDRSANISIYPNPASDHITLNIPSGLLGSDVLITNQLGQQVKWIGNVTTTRLQVDCSTFASGIYLVHVGNRNVKLVIS